MSAPVPLVLLAGFLGAGKTTLLRTLLPQLQQMGVVPHVILNDHQNAVFDAELLVDLAASLTPISGSCVCCGSRDELMDALYLAKLDEHSVMLVEASGTVDPDQLIELLTLDPRATRYTLPWQLSVIDAEGWQRREDVNWMEEAQVKTATHIYLSHSDEASTRRMKRVREEVSTLVPKALWITPTSFVEDLAALRAASAKLPPRLRPADQKRPLAHTSRSLSKLKRPHADFHFSSMEVLLPPVVTEEALVEFFSQLPREVLRAKGLAVFAESPTGHTIFNWIGKYRNHVFNPFRSRPSIAPMMILIGTHISRPVIERAIVRLAEAYPAAR